MSNPCLYCGECLNRCIYLRLDKDEAAREMRRLDQGQPTPHLDAHCISCYACNAFCPNDADPYGRILASWHARYIAKGLPERARYLLPTARKSFRTDVVAKLPPDEKQITEKWAAAKPRGDVLYPGCNLITSAYLTQSGVFDALTICGSLELCCGEMYFRMGMFDHARRAAERVVGHFNKHRIKRLIVACPAGYNMFAHVYPERFGLRFDFPLVFYADYLREQFDKGKLDVVRPLNRTVVMHDSCHARVLGEPMDSVRELLRRIGAQTVEARHSREEGLCCGIAAGAPRQSPIDIAKVALRAHGEYKLSGGEQIATYCTGCHLTLGMLRPPVVGLPVAHLLALVAEAVGRPVNDRLGARTRAMLTGIARHALPKILSPKRFWVG